MFDIQINHLNRRFRGSAPAAVASPTGIVRIRVLLHFLIVIEIFPNGYPYGRGAGRG